jgi:hypothetical protein
VSQPTDVTPASEWRSAITEGFIVPLPSGRVARLRRTLDLIELIKTGQIPNPLAGAINTMIKESSTSTTFDLRKLPEEAIPQMLDLVDKSMERIFVYPKVVEPPEGSGIDWLPEDPETISVWAIDAQDRMFAFGFAQGGPGSLAPFRAKQAEAVAGITDGDEVPDTPVSTGGAE